MASSDNELNATQKQNKRILKTKTTIQKNIHFLKQLKYERANATTLAQDTRNTLLAHLLLKTLVIARRTVDVARDVTARVNCARETKQRRSLHERTKTTKRKTSKYYYNTCYYYFYNVQFK